MRKRRPDPRTDAFETLRKAAGVDSRRPDRAGYSVSADERNRARRSDAMRRAVGGVLVAIVPLLAGFGVAWKLWLAPSPSSPEAGARETSTLEGAASELPEYAAAGAEADPAATAAQPVPEVPAPDEPPVTDDGAVGTAEPPSSEPPAAAPPRARARDLSPLELSRIRREVAAEVQAWSEAWSLRDADRYLAHYAEDFTPADAASREAWVAARRRTLERTPWIRVAVVGLDVATDGRGTAVATFTETVRREGRPQAVVRKELILRDRGPRWLIVGERTLRSLPAR